jgi:pyruvate dehydrogenase E1 component beta subunit
MFALFPGLKVVMPVYPADAKGMIAAAVADDNPVICIESRWAHYAQGHVPDGYFVERLDGPKVIREGSDITIVASSYMVLEAMRAAKQLSKEDVSVEVLDLRVLRPLNMEPILRSVGKTGAILTVDTGFRTLGMGAEIVAEVSQRAFGNLKYAPARLGMPDHPTPSSRGLVAGLYPDAKRIVAEVGGGCGLAQDKIDACFARLDAERGDLPVDVPDQYFRGPF